MNIEAAKIFSQLILSDRTIRIKLLGDSITHGVGGTGFAQNGDPIVPGYARNPNGHCWANLFRDYLESQYDCKVFNNACTGTTIQFILENFDALVAPEDDIVVCVIGTNNRHQYFKDGPQMTRKGYMQQFYRYILELHAKFQAAGKTVIFVANIPAGYPNEQDGEEFWRLFHMNDVQDLYLKASFACGFPLICLYTRFLEYCRYCHVSVNALLADTLHPNDEGHRVMFRLMLSELGIAEKITEEGF